MLFFDCNVQIGRRNNINPGSFYTVEDMVSKMAYYGIDKALVYHSFARELDPAEGNRRLMEEIAPYPQLEPVWVVLPNGTGEFIEPEALVAQMKQSGVRAVKIFPSAAEHNFSTADYCCKKLFDCLEEHKIPLFVGLTQIGFDEVYRLCQNHPQLRVVLTDINYRVDRNLYPLLQQCEHLYIETIGYKAHQGIETLCKRFSGKRILFGSNMPVHSGASATGMIRYLTLPEQEKEDIASGNLMQLLNEVTI